MRRDLQSMGRGMAAGIRSHGECPGASARGCCTDGCAARAMCPAQVQWGRLAAAQRPTAPDAYGAGEPGTLCGLTF